MAETIDEATLIAWVDGEIGETESARVARAVAADPELAMLADRHRRMKARFAAAFGEILEEVPAAMPAPVISLAAVRAERGARVKAVRPPQRWWSVGGMIAASLLVGVLVGRGVGDPAGITDSPRALALSTPIAHALDSQLSGDDGVVQVALSFKDRDGHYCRSFSARNLSGVACRDDGDWWLRYVSPASPQRTDYHMAGDDDAEMRFIQSAMTGEPLDHDAEVKARASRWGR